MSLKCPGWKKRGFFLNCIVLRCNLKKWADYNGQEILNEANNRREWSHELYNVRGGEWSMKPAPWSSVTPYSNTHHTIHNTKVEDVPKYPQDSGLLDT